MKAWRRSGEAISGVLLAALALLPVAARAEYTLTVLAEEGDPAPGTDLVFLGFEHGQMYISNEGRIVFGASVAEPGSFESRPGLWVYDPSAEGGEIRKLALAMDPVPGLADTFFGDGFNLWGSLSKDATVSVQTDLAGSGVDSSNDTALFVERQGGLEVLLRAGAGALGPLVAFGSHPFNAGQVVGETLISHDFDTSIFVAGPGNGEVRELARRNTPLAVLPDVTVTSFQGNSSITFDDGPVINPSGEVAFIARTTSLGGRKLILKGSSAETLQVLLNEESGSPDTFFTYGLTINFAGQVAFFGGPPENLGVWVCDDACSNRLPLGTALPGAEGYAFAQDPRFVSGHILLDNSRLAILARVENGEEFKTGVWIEGAGGFEKVALAGDEVPGMPGLFFNTVGNPLNQGNAPPDLVANFNGEVAFTARLEGAGVNFFNDTALFAGGVGDLRMVSRKGDFVSFAEFSESILFLNVPHSAYSQIELGGIGRTGADGLSTHFNDAGALVFSVRTNSTSGLVLAEKEVLVPTATPTEGPSETATPSATETETAPPSATETHTVTPTPPPTPTPTMPTPDESPTPPTLDFGDAPDGVGDPSIPTPGYPTLLESDGARHAVVAGFQLGEFNDSEGNGLPTIDATGDDDNRDPDDEDGVEFLDSFDVGSKPRVRVTAAQLGRLDAWADYNRDGDWEDEGEQIFASVELQPGQNDLQTDVPANAASGLTFARFRYSTAGGLSFDGAAADGEVEDYRIEVVRRGDANGDGVVDADDARAAVDSIFAVMSPTGADANADGALTAADVTAIITTF